MHEVGLWEIVKLLFGFDRLGCHDNALRVIKQSFTLC